MPFRIFKFTAHTNLLTGFGCVLRDTSKQIRISTHHTTFHPVVTQLTFTISAFVDGSVTVWAETVVTSNGVGTCPRSANISHYSTFIDICRNKYKLFKSLFSLQLIFVCIWLQACFVFIAGGYRTMSYHDSTFWAFASCLQQDLIFVRGKPLHCMEKFVRFWGLLSPYLHKLWMLRSTYILPYKHRQRIRKHSGMFRLGTDQAVPCIHRYLPRVWWLDLVWNHRRRGRESCTVDWGCGNLITPYIKSWKFRGQVQKYDRGSPWALFGFGNTILTLALPGVADVNKSNSRHTE